MQQHSTQSGLSPYSSLKAIDVEISQYNIFDISNISNDATFYRRCMEYWLKCIRHDKSLFIYHCQVYNIIFTSCHRVSSIGRDVPPIWNTLNGMVGSVSNMNDDHFG